MTTNSQLTKCEHYPVAFTTAQFLHTRNKRLQFCFQKKNLHNCTNAIVECCIPIHIYTKKKKTKRNAVYSKTLRVPWTQSQIQSNHQSYSHHLVR